MSERATSGMTALLRNMHESPVLSDGWDVALHLSETAFQALVHHDWDRGADATDDRPLTWIAPEHADGQHDVLEVHTSLAPPSVKLNTDKQSARLNFAIDRGSLRTGKVAAEAIARAADPLAVAQGDEVTWSDSIKITKNKPLALDGHVPVVARALPDGNGFAIELDLHQTALTLSAADYGGIVSQGREPKIQSWLQNQQITGQIAVFSTPGSGAEHMLTPNKLVVRVVESAVGHPVLQILTASDGMASTSAIVPAPNLDGHDFNIVVSSKAAMTMIANAYNLGAGDIKLDPLPPEDGRPQWRVRVREPMVFTGAFAIDGGETIATDHSELQIRFGGSPDQGLRLSTFIDPSSTIELELKLAANYPVDVSGSGASQMVGLVEGAQSVVGEGFYEHLVQPQLKSFLTGQIKSDMTQVKMHAISKLALQDLKLSGHALSFESAALPAELVIAGSLTRSA